MITSQACSNAHRKLRIGFLLPSLFALGNRGNGIAEQARRQVDALNMRGHDVIRLTPWDWHDFSQFDVVQFFLGGPFFHGVEAHRRNRSPGLLVFAPIIDSNRSNLTYWAASQLGSFSPRLMTVPGLFRRQVAGADLVVCRSEHEKLRVVHGLGAASEKVEIILNGALPPLVDSELIRRTIAAHNLPQEFVLHISAYTQDRKNVLRLIDAVEPLGYPLVIAGAGMPGLIMDLLRQKALDNRFLTILDFVDSATKASLYAACKVFCLPSQHEGTGLVALEAGSYGANIVITQNGGTKDYFGAHAEYVDPFNVDSIRHSIVRAWNRPRNDSLRTHIAEHLTWDKSALALESAYTKHLLMKENRANRDIHL